MNREIVENIIRFVVLILLQGLVLINMNLYDGSMQIYYYILFILLLPLRTPPALTMFLAFILGLCVDMFYNTMGVHASACLVIGFARGRILELLAPRDGYDIKDRPTVSGLGLSWFVQYAVLVTLIHHIWLFLIEAFKVEGILSTLGSAFLSVLFTFLVLVLGQFLFHRQRKGAL
jgi:hypothetical protein